MSEFRQDPMTHEWVVLSPGRSKRPEAFVPKRTNRDTHKNCVFCEGNENQTPKEVFAIRPSDTKPNTKGWDVRVIPNKFPVFTENARVKKTQSDKFFKAEAAHGIHEVLITKNPHKDIGQLSKYKVQQVVESYLQRFNFHKHDPYTDLKYILIMQNHGKTSGASIAHPHSQIFGFGNIENSLLEKELVGARNYHIRNKKCVFCEMIEKEMMNSKRVIYENDHFIAFCPYASRSPFETWILPKFHNGFFEYMKIDQIESFAEALQTVLKKIYKGLKNPDYNFYIHTAPVKFVSSRAREDILDYYHWHVEIMPKLTTWGGFEYGTNMKIDVVTPEDSARFLRKADR